MHNVQLYRSLLVFHSCHVSIARQFSCVLTSACSPPFYRYILTCAIDFYGKFFALDSVLLGVGVENAETEGQANDDHLATHKNLPNNSIECPPGTHGFQTPTRIRNRSFLFPERYSHPCFCCLPMARCCMEDCDYLTYSDYSLQELMLGFFQFQRKIAKFCILKYAVYCIVKQSLCFMGHQVKTCSDLVRARATNKTLIEQRKILALCFSNSFWQSQACLYCCLMLLPICHCLTHPAVPLLICLSTSLLRCNMHAQGISYMETTIHNQQKFDLLDSFL